MVIFCYIIKNGQIHRGPPSLNFFKKLSFFLKERTSFIHRRNIKKKVFYGEGDHRKKRDFKRKAKRIPHITVLKNRFQGGLRV
jgi:hypothetical protein